MTEDYYDNIKKSVEVFGSSAFSCRTCRKVVVKLNKGQKEMEARLKAMEKENETLKGQVDALERKMTGYEGGLKKVETGLEKAKEEVREEVRLDIIEKEKRSNNLVIYGLKESDKNEPKERVKEDEEQVKKIWTSLEMLMDRDDAEVKFRAGKKRGWEIQATDCKV